MSTSVTEVMRGLPRDVYIRHERHGDTVHYSLPEAVARELTALQVRPGDRVLEVGTGSGWTGALLAGLAGPDGRVISVDISEELAGRAERIHRDRGVENVSCHVGDGLAGFSEAGLLDRVVVWCTPPRVPDALVGQVVDGGRMVVCLPIAELPFLTVVATITLAGGQPAVQAITSGGYVQSRTTPSDEVVVPHRWVDAMTDGPRPSWVSIAWRDRDTSDGIGARTVLDRLLHPGHTVTYGRGDVDWNSWNAFSATLNDPALSTADLRGRMRAIGHSTPDSAAMLQVDGTIVADAEGSPSLTILRTWLELWERAGRPAADRLTPALVRNDDPGCAGWDLRVSW
ncbi:hypothetical protein GCM10010435_07880 [Winogradskya consettensis]|uniref:Protein-L-isoaspartate O-methyltransferase n=1 Tax=Winogradskya consettensis TaxID=113560 RepID=A0A919W5C8_9ACTN|nr:methyltransferase domain-containing protein [Actinoplanes consettensis]GIM80413.1 hypothetical protein Aco04nite_70600 [Actinoplanes consettensis]